jgi:uncharacterized membrane protein
LTSLFIFAIIRVEVNKLARIFTITLVLVILLVTLLFITTLWLLQGAMRYTDFATHNLGVIRDANGGWALFCLVFLPIAFLAAVVWSLLIGVRLIEILLRRLEVEAPRGRDSQQE